MKRWFLAILAALLLLAPTSVSAETADWGMCAANNNEYSVFYTIDINSLQVDSFTTVNNSAQTGYMYITEDGVVIFEMLVGPYTTEVKPISQFKFRRIPATDHDDPNSIRYPSGISMFCRWPAF